MAFFASCCQCLRSNWLLLCTILGVICGITLGILVKTYCGVLSKRDAMYLSFGGEIFLNMLKALILPLIFSSIVAAIGSMDLHASWKIGVRSLVFYALSTIVAIVTGCVVVLIIHPGNNTLPPPPNDRSADVLTQDLMLDLVRNMFPSNLVQAAFSLQRTVLVKPNASIFPVPPRETWDTERKSSDGLNMLGTVTAAIVFGTAITLVGAEKNQTLVDGFKIFSSAMMIAINWVIMLSPIGVLFLIAGKVAALKDYGVIAGSLGMYVLSVLVGLAFHFFVTLPLTYALIARHLPFRFMFNMGNAVLTGFGTSSSQATLPLTMKCLEENNGLDPRLVRFVMPIGTALNMNGTALYEAVAVIYLLQMHEGTNVSIGVVVVVCVTATLASIATAGVPASLMNVVMMLTVVGLPASDISYLLTIDWFLDRLRTVVNIMADAVGAGIVAAMSTKDLENMEPLPPPV